ncbi:MAG: hypothetical protein JW772_04030 [Candidatus Diapherotrites archaeon]|nr:hypothetical protein [Candidatus Diapherotrites archaeon]
MNSKILLLIPLIIVALFLASVATAATPEPDLTGQKCYGWSYLKGEVGTISGYDSYWSQWVCKIGGKQLREESNLWTTDHCKDHLQDEDETGVDCGGSCKKFCSECEYDWECEEDEKCMWHQDIPFDDPEYGQGYDGHRICFPTIEKNCTDGIDDDEDSKVDCDDWDCHEDPVCGETTCNDREDNDRDGYMDCDDPDCFEDDFCTTEWICNDGVDGDKDGFIDCADEDCWIRKECMASVTLYLDSKVVYADGEDTLEISGFVREGENNLDGRTVSISITAQDAAWQAYVGTPEASTVSLQNNEFVTHYMASGFFQAHQQGHKFEEITLTITATYVTMSGQTLQDSKNVIVKPTVMAEIRVLEAFQALRKAKHVAGKKTVVMVGVKAEQESFFWETENQSPRMQLDIEGDTFTPKNVFPDVSLINGPSEDWGKMAEGEELEDYFDFFEIPQNERSIGTWRFYEFYVDPQNTEYKGEYIFKAKIYVTKMSDSGDVTQIELDRKGIAYDVYPSARVYIKTVPIGIGFWAKDFCDYCVFKNATPGFPIPLQDRPEDRIIQVNFSDLLASIHYDFSCDAQDFKFAGYEFSGVIDYARIQKRTSQKDLPSIACKQGIEKVFPNNQLQSIATESQQTPKATLPTGQTNLQNYLDLAYSSKSFFEAIMPVAEENIIFTVSEDPFESPSFTARTSSVGEILSAMNELPSGMYKFNIGFVPTKQRQLSNVQMAENTIVGLIDWGFEGYTNAFRNRKAALVDADNGGSSIMAHEIMHLFCAIDEGGRLHETSDTTLTAISCPYGKLAINANLGGDEWGTRVTDGYWVGKHEFQGTPSKNKYSLMNASPKVTDNQRWVTYNLYYGVGEILGTFPTPKDDCPPGAVYCPSPNTPAVK